MQCVILAGGLGTRLGPIAATVPKHLLVVGGRPFADHQLAWLAGQGVDDVVYCVGHGGDLIRHHVTRQAPDSVQVRFVDEGDQLRGTGGALRLAADRGCLDDRFFVLYGDSLLDIELRSVLDAFESAACPALMTVFRNHDQLDRSNADFDGRLVRYDKRHPTPDMEWIDYGLSVLTPAVLDPIASGEVADLADVLTGLGDRCCLAGFEAVHRFYEIGTPEALAELDALMRSGGLRGDGPGSGRVVV